MDLKQLRILKGVTASDVAKECGISKQSYSAIERGGIAHANEKNARSIAEYFGVNLFSLVGADVLKFKPLNAEEWDVLMESLAKEASK